MRLQLHILIRIFIVLTYLQVKHDGAKATMGKSANISAWTKALGVTVFFTAMHLQLEEEVSLNVLDKAENYLNRDFLIFYIEVCTKYFWEYQNMMVVLKKSNCEIVLNCEVN